MPGAPDIIVRVGAAKDRSVDTVFGDIEKQSKRAFESTRRESNRLAKSRQTDSSQMLTAAKQASSVEMKLARDVYRENSRLNRLVAIEKLRTERALTLQANRMNRERTRDRLAAISEEEKAERAYQNRLLQMKIRSTREQSRMERNAARERSREEYRQSREIDRFATRTSHRATRFFFPRPEGALGYSKRIASDLMRGAGVDFSLSGGVARAREREFAGMGLAQQERIATGKSQGGAFWAGKGLEVGTDLQTDPEKITEMMRAFTGKTGDFGAAAEQAKALASMTLASGANMDEMVSAAGYVYNQLKGMPDAAKLTLDVMRGIVGQTAVGAVEMEEYAKQMGRIAANAKMFEGDVSKNILELSALTQLSIAEGGATSGADAARSIASFANTTSKGQRINAFKKYGVDLFNNEGTQKRPILDIIKDSLIASKGNIPKMTQMWADTLGQKPIRGITNAFNAAGGGEKGWEAALAKIKPFMDAQLSKEAEKKNIEDYQSTTTAKAQAFQNKLDLITTSLANRLLPAMEQLAPKALQLAKTFSDAIAWAAGNPWKAVMALLGASVARAASESLGRLILERGITGLLGGGAAAASGVAGVAGNGGGVVGALAGSTAGTVAAGVASTAGVLAMGAASFMITTAIIRATDVNMMNEKKERSDAMNAAFFDFQKEYASAKNDEERAAAVKRAKYNVDQVDEPHKQWWGESGEHKKTIAAINETMAAEDSRRKEREAAAAPKTESAKIDAGAAMATMIAGVMNEVLGKQLQVRVVNPDDFKFSTTVTGGMSSASGLPTFGQ